jgi:hypothetical protein
VNKSPRWRVYMYGMLASGLLLVLSLVVGSGIVMTFFALPQLRLQANRPAMPDLLLVLDEWLFPSRHFYMT